MLKFLIVAERCVHYNTCSFDVYVHTNISAIRLRSSRKLVASDLRIFFVAVLLILNEVIIVLAAMLFYFFDQKLMSKGPTISKFSMRSQKLNNLR
jgi:hypothetical protein